MPRPKSVRRSVTICNRRGLHARAAALIAKLAEDREAKINVCANGLTVSARSIMGLMLLAAGPGTTVEIKATGAGAEEAVAALASMIEAGFNEED